MSEVKPASVRRVLPQDEAARSQESDDKLAELLASVRRKGIRLWPENGELRYRGPRDVLTSDEREGLRCSRGRIVALLERAASAKLLEPKPMPQRQRTRAPLTFSQLAHWRSFRLIERRSVRQIATAVSLSGRLHLDALRKAFTEIIQRQDALRTRVITHDGIPVQEILESDHFEMPCFDLTDVPAELQENEVRRRIDAQILDPVDVSADTLYSVQLLRLREREHVLIVTMEHMISDMFSVSIVLRDILAAYRQVLRGPVTLPPVLLQLADYADWQKSSHACWIEKHGTYWNELIAGYQRPVFPGDSGTPATVHPGWGSIPLQIRRGMASELREWCRLRRTTAPMAVFTAYVGLVLRWCNSSESVVRYQSDGRVSPDIQNTVGFFASSLYVRATLLEEDRFLDLMDSVTRAYCTACEHADFSYVAAQEPRTDITRTCLFNWIPQATIDCSDTEVSEYALTCSRIRFEHPLLKNLELDMDPSVVLCDTQEEIIGDVHFPLSRFSTDTMERFARCFLLFLETLIRQPEQRVKAVQIPPVVP